MLVQCSAVDSVKMRPLQPELSSTGGCPTCCCTAATITAWGVCFANGDSSLRRILLHIVTGLPQQPVGSMDKADGLDAPGKQQGCRLRIRPIRLTQAPLLQLGMIVGWTLNLRLICLSILTANKARSTLTQAAAVKGQLQYAAACCLPQSPCPDQASGLVQQQQEPFSRLSQSRWSGELRRNPCAGCVVDLGPRLRSKQQPCCDDCGSAAAG